MIDETFLEEEIKNFIIYKKALFNADPSNEKQPLSKPIWRCRRTPTGWIASVGNACKQNKHTGSGENVKKMMYQLESLKKKGGTDSGLDMGSLN